MDRQTSIAFFESNEKSILFGGQTLKIKAKSIIFGMLLFSLFLNSLGYVIAKQTKVNLKYTHHFAIEYLRNGWKEVTDAAGNKLLLIQRDRGRTKENYPFPVIYTPVHKVLFTSMTQVSLLRPFHDRRVWESIGGVTSPLQEWYIPEIRKGLQNGSIQFVGDGYEPDYEKIQALEPEIVFVYGGPAGQVNLTKKLTELKIPYAVDNDYLETSPLGQLEWIKFIAAFYNKEQEAGEYVNRVERRVSEITQKLQGLPKSKIAWGIIYDGKVYIPDGDSYVAKMISMAGGDYVFKQIKIKNTAISIEAFYAGSHNADILIYSSFPANIPSIKTIVDNAPVLQDIKAIRGQQVWCFQPWYNQMLDQTDQILLDLVAILHPEVIKKEVKNFHKVPLNLK